jgi:hypothetical protein
MTQTFRPDMPVRRIVRIRPLNKSKAHASGQNLTPSGGFNWLRKRLRGLVARGL